MPSMLSYTSGAGKVEIQMDVMPVYVETAEDMRGREWDYTLQYRGISGASRPAREIELDTWVLDREKADEMRHVFDRDVAMSTPGTLTVGGEWTQRAYVTAAQVRGVYGRTIAQRLTVVLLDGAWRRDNVMHFVAEEGGGSSYAYLDYRFDYDYDYGENPQPEYVAGGAWMASPVRIIVYGPVTNPSVTIGGNAYTVNAVVPSGGYLVIDGIDHAVATTTQNGTITNVFDSAVRTGGEGGGTYIFEKLPTGTSAVSWDKTFSFDLHWYDEEGEPPWA